MEGYQYLNAASRIFFDEDKIQSTLWAGFNAVLNNPDLADFVNVKAYTGKVIQAPDSNFAFLVLMHKPTQAIVVLSELVFRFGAKRSLKEMFSFPVSIIKKEGPAPDKFYVSKVLCIPKPVSSLDLIGRYKNEKIKTCTGSERTITEMIEALALYDTKVSRLAKSIPVVLIDANKEFARTMGEMSFSTEIQDEHPKKSTYNMAYWIEAAYQALLKKKFIVQDVEDFNSNKKALTFCDMDYHAAVWQKDQSNTRYLAVSDQSCGFIVKYDGPGNYSVFCADLTCTDAGLGDFKKATSLPELALAVEKGGQIDAQFLMDNAVVIVKDSELKYITGGLVYCLYMDLKGAIEEVKSRKSS